MIATVSIDDELFAKAQQFAGVAETSAIVDEALRSFVQRETARRLAGAGGTRIDAHVPPRRRP
ncbi:type II toxin-antitoxin system VapB family antitoxin [Bradyrhizobium sp. LTSP849]|uniref:type II toxin-antitoxin system VapB family antitoxin n=1 Tax=Bradyrhizobium sp. LTSP849 TaxID=1615890 RepID=UPI0009E4C53A|nr:type II toxin-antitoxin system VapB family antitoxin [Bradyrhizobium sp. LTSP849]